MVKLLSAWHGKKVCGRRIQSLGPGGGPKVTRRDLLSLRDLRGGVVVRLGERIVRAYLGNSLL